MSRFASPMARDFELVLLQEIGSGRGTTRSMGVLYAMLMACARSDDEDAAFQPVNRAIMDAFNDPRGRGRLDRVKAVAWEVYERTASCDRNPEGEKPQALSAKHESAVGEAETPNPSNSQTSNGS